MLGPSAHLDTFARDHLPPPAEWPDFLHSGFDYPEHLNVAVELTDRMVEKGFGDNIALIGHGRLRTYKELADWTNRLARALTEDLGIVPGNRILIRSANNPAMVACWIAAMKAGAVVINTVPSLRAADLGKVIDKAEVKLALCDTRLMDELIAAAKAEPFPEEGDRLRRHREFRRGARPDRAREAGPLRRREDRPRRCRAHRLQHRRDRRAEGGDAFPSRSARHRRRLREGSARDHAERRGRRHAAARLHLRARRPRRSSRCASAPRRFCSKRRRRPCLPARSRPTRRRSRSLPPASTSASSR